jgi:hypothetical protein
MASRIHIGSGPRATARRMSCDPTVRRVASPSRSVRAISGEQHGRRPRRLPVDVGSPLLFVVCAAIAVGVFAMHEVRGAYRCDSDTSFCAESRDKVSVYQGVLRMRKGGPALPDQAFDVSFETRHSEGYGPVRFRSDGSGRYCYVWTIEAIEPPPVKVGGQGARLDEVEGSPAKGPPPSDCQRTSAIVPWRATEGLGSAAPFLVVVGLSALAFALSALVAPLTALTGVAGRRARPWIGVAAAVATAAAVIGYAIVWHAPI